MTARLRHMAEFMARMYPAFSRRATQVCILSSALERIAAGDADAPAIARAALAQANPFAWNERRESALRMAGAAGLLPDPDVVPAGVPGQDGSQHG